MIVHLVRDVPADMMEIYVLSDQGKPRGYLKDGTWHPYIMGERPEPMIRMEMPIWMAIYAEACLSSNVDFDALKDAREVRDRLLSLVESQWEKQ